MYPMSINSGYFSILRASTSVAVVPELHKEGAVRLDLMNLREYTYCHWDRSKKVNDNIRAWATSDRSWVVGLM